MHDGEDDAASLVQNQFEMQSRDASAAELSLVRGQTLVVEDGSSTRRNVTALSQIHTIDDSPVTDRELKAWYGFAFCSDGFAALALSVFLPLIIESQTAKSGVTADDHSQPCNTTVSGYRCVTQIGSLWVDPTSFFLYTHALSTLIQLVIFLFVGSLADHANYRKRFLQFFSIVGSISGSLFFLALKDSLFWLSALLYLMSSVCYGASYAFYHAWLPVLVQRHKDVIDASDRDDYNEVSDRVTNMLSSRGYFWNYTGAILTIIMGSAIVLAFRDPASLGLPTVYGLQVGSCFAALFWLSLLYVVFKNLPPRPGPPLPRGASVFTYSIRRVVKTFGKCRKLKNLFLFLLGWFVYSDSFQTVISVAILYAQTELGMKTTQLLILLLLVVVVQSGGALLWNFIQRRFNISTKRILIIQVSLYTLLPLWALVGFLSQRVGLRTITEVYILGAWHGFVFGGTQSTCRSIMSELLPRGSESEFFALFEITDKGSTWIGPLVVGAIDDATGQKRYAFLFIFVMMVLPLAFFAPLKIGEGKLEAKRFAEEETKKITDS